MTRLAPLVDGLREAFFMFWETLWALVLGFGLSGAVQAFVPRDRMERAFGRLDPRSVGRATLFGMASSSCSYAATAMAKSLVSKGADFTVAMIFMFASTNLVIELGIVLALLLGWQFTASEFLGGLLMIGLLALIARFVFPTRLVDAARHRLAVRGSEEHDQGGEVAEGGEPAIPLRRRLRSLAGWSDAAGYAMADITMLRREMLIGYGVAGFLAVLVPVSLWNTIFMSGHGFWTTLENVAVGPLIAIVSFVCSIGNVPLAAALWKGGISFGGVASFIFADLITLPLMLIYRRFYGWRLTLRMLGTFWLVMSAAGLGIEYVFAAVHAVPAARPAEIVNTSPAWNYTSVLNILALAAFAGIVWLARNRERFGGGAGYARDPVCGMQVRTVNAPARAVHDGATHYFCSDRCHDRFTAGPAGFVAHEPRPATETDPGSVADPVCGMTVDPATASAHRVRDGRDHWFCGTGCAARFDSTPAITQPATRPR